MQRNRLTYPSLAAVFHAAVKYAPSGLSAEQIADRLGKNYPTLMCELSCQKGHKLAADLVLPLMDATGADEPLHFLAGQMGGVFVKLPEVDAPMQAMTRQTIDAMHTSAELLTAVADSLKDEKISLGELELIGKKSNAAITSMLQLLRMLERVQTNGALL